MLINTTTLTSRAKNQTNQSLLTLLSFNTCQKQFILVIEN